MIELSKTIPVFLTALTSFILPTSSSAITVTPDFSLHYSATDLGSVTGVPGSYGGLSFKLGDPNTLLLGGNANTASGRLYEVQVVRDGSGSIVGFQPNPGTLGDVGDYNDGGVAYGPNNILFTAQWNQNNLGQTKLGSSDEDRVDPLGPLGVGGSSIAALNFVPAGFAGAGKLKVSAWSSGNWYDLELVPDGSGTFTPASATQVDLDPVAPGIQTLPGGPEGFVYIAAGNPGFSVDSLLVSNYSANTISAYDLDSDGNPLIATGRDFITDLVNAEGAVIDPLTGDFLFSTFGGGDRIVKVSGFNAPTPPELVPLPASVWLLFGGVVGLGFLRRRKI